MSGNNDNSTVALLSLAAAQDRFAEEQKGVKEELEKQNGYARDHSIAIAVGQQWVKSHTGDNSIHAILTRDVAIANKKASAAIALNTILALGGLAVGVIAALR